MGITQRWYGYHTEMVWVSHRDGMGITKRWYGYHTEMVWVSHRDGMGITQRWEGVHATAKLQPTAHLAGAGWSLGAVH